LVWETAPGKEKALRAFISALAHLAVFKNDPLRDKRPIRDGRLREIKGQDGFEAMVFGSL
jgi:hypothetical protein